MISNTAPTTAERPTSGIDPIEKQLTAHTSRGVVLGGGGCTLAAGLSVLLLGLWSVAFALRLPPSDDDTRPVFVAVGSAFALFGLLLVGGSVRGLFRHWRHRRWAAAHPDEPWFGDHRWDRHGSDGLAAPFLGKLAFFVLLLLVLLSPVLWTTPEAAREWAEGVGRRLQADFWGSGLDSLVPIFGGVLCIGGPVLLLFFAVGRAARHRLRYGTGRLVFGAFPFYVGESVQARLQVRNPRPGFERLSVTLRCIEERAESELEAGGKVNVLNTYQLYAEARVFERADLGSFSDLPLYFDLPAGDYETRLSGLPPRYWELSVKAEAPGQDFAADFLVPVYERPGP